MIVHVEIQLDKLLLVAEQCRNELLDSSNGTLRNCQFSSFNSDYQETPPSAVAPSSSSGWKPFIRSGFYENWRHINILFGRLTNLSSVILNLKNPENKVLEMAVLQTNDGRAFTPYKSVSKKSNFWRCITPCHCFTCICGWDLSLYKGSVHKCSSFVHKIFPPSYFSEFELKKMCFVVIEFLIIFPLKLLDIPLKD